MENQQKSFKCLPEKLKRKSKYTNLNLYIYIKENYELKFSQLLSTTLFSVNVVPKRNDF